MRIKGLIMRYLILVFICFVFTGCEGANKWEETIAKSKKSVVVIDFYERAVKQIEESEGIKMTDESLMLNLATGVLVSSDGYILTNYHVIDKLSKIPVTLNDGRIYNASLVGAWKGGDLALLKIEEQNLPFLEIGSDDEVKVGQEIITMGSTLDFPYSVGKGIVSAKNRCIRDYARVPLTQVDALIDLGTSGGALINAEGELIGITCLRPSGPVFGGIGFAISSVVLKHIFTRFKEHKNIEIENLGIEVRDLNNRLINLLKLKANQGVYVASLTNNSPFKSIVDKQSIITKINGKAIRSIGDFYACVFAADGELRINYISAEGENKIGLINRLVIAKTKDSSQKKGIRFEEEFTFEEIKAKALAENKMIFVDVFTTWCGPCKMLVKKTFPDAELGAYFNERFISASIDAEKGEGKEIAKAYGVTAYPTLLFLSANGDLVYKAMGSMPPKQLINEGRKALDPLFLRQLKEENKKILKDLSDAQAQYDRNKKNPESVMNYVKVLMNTEKKSDAEKADSIINVYCSQELVKKKVLDVQLEYLKILNPSYHLDTINKLFKQILNEEPDRIMNVNFMSENWALIGIYLQQHIYDTDFTDYIYTNNDLIDSLLKKQNEIYSPKERLNFAFSGELQAYASYKGMHYNNSDSLNLLIEKASKYDFEGFSPIVNMMKMSFSLKIDHEVEAEKQLLKILKNKKTGAWERCQSLSLFISVLNTKEEKIKYRIKNMLKQQLDKYGLQVDNSIYNDCYFDYYILYKDESNARIYFEKIKNAGGSDDNFESFLDEMENKLIKLSKDADL
jgi:S1-C subfamily serine protease/thioredoxin-related protein